MLCMASNHKLPTGHANWATYRREQIQVSCAHAPRYYSLYVLLCAKKRTVWQPTAVYLSVRDSCDAHNLTFPQHTSISPPSVPILAHRHWIVRRGFASSISLFTIFKQHLHAPTSVKQIQWLSVHMLRDCNDVSTQPRKDLGATAIATIHNRNDQKTT